MSVEIKDNTAEFKRAFKSATEKGLDLIGKQATAHTVQNTPRRTGNLMNHADYEVDGADESVYIGFKKDSNKKLDTTYAIFLEEGSRNNTAHHMLRRAATEHTSEYQKIYEDVLKNG